MGFEISLNSGRENEEDRKDKRKTGSDSIVQISKESEINHDHFGAGPVTVVVKQE